MPSARSDAAAAVVQELRDALAGQSPSWMPPEVAAAVKANPGFVDRLAEGLPPAASGAG